MSPHANSNYRFKARFMRSLSLTRKKEIFMMRNQLVCVGFESLNSRQIEKLMMWFVSRELGLGTVERVKKVCD